MNRVKGFAFINIVCLMVLFGACEEKSPQDNIPINVPAIYFNAHDGVYTNQNGIFLRAGKPFTGFLFSNYSEKDTAEIIPYYAGLEEGWTRKWYPNHKRAEERLYHLGRKEGIHQGWWQNGQLKFVYNFKNDNHEGKSQTWYSTGQPATENFYESGYEIGLQRAWYADGILSANYEARNGRQYGLTGVKNCASVWDSITNKFVEKSIAKHIKL